MKKLFLYVLLFLILPAVCWAQPWSSGEWKVYDSMITPTYSYPVQISALTDTNNIYNDGVINMVPSNDRDDYLALSSTGAAFILSAVDSAVLLKATGSVSIVPSGDNNDFAYFVTTGDVVQLTTSSNSAYENFEIGSASGMVEIKKSNLLLNSDRKILGTSHDGDQVELTFIDVNQYVLRDIDAIHDADNPALLFEVDRYEYPGGLTLTGITVTTNFLINDSGISFVERTLSGVNTWSDTEKVAAVTFTWLEGSSEGSGNFLTDTFLAAGSYLWGYIAPDNITATTWIVKIKGWKNPYY